MCWEDGELRFYDPVAEDYLPGHEEERAGRQEAELRAERERAGRREAESRVAELEAELRRLPWE